MGSYPTPDSFCDQENAPAVLLHDSMPNGLKLTTLCIASLLESILLPTFPPKHKQNPLNPITSLNHHQQN